MEKLRFPLELKQLDEDGTFVALAAVYGTPDRLGDIIKKGAFTKSVAEKPTTRNSTAASFNLLTVSSSRVRAGTGEPAFR